MPSFDRDTIRAAAAVPVGEARAGLSRVLRDFRVRGAEAPPVVIGSHRRPEAVLVPYEALGLFSAAAVPAPGQLLDLLHRRKLLIERLARANRIRAVQVFGSVARGEETPRSDVDLLVDPESDASLFDIAQFEIDMEALLERPVDVVSRRSLDPTRDSAVLDEARDL